MDNAHHLAEHERRMAALKEEFDAGPRAYIAKYGSINSTETSMLDLWLLERVERCDALAVENVALAAGIKMANDAMLELLPRVLRALDPKREPALSVAAMLDFIRAAQSKP